MRIIKSNQIFLSMVLFFVFLSASLSDNTFFAFAQEEQIDVTDEKEDKIISLMTEVVGISTLVGISGIIFMFYYKNQKDHNIIKNKLLWPISILSLGAGIIHLLLVQEHMEEVFEWGILFLISGILQVVFCLLYISSKNMNKILSYIGIIGNTVLTLIFVYVRISPNVPFSTENGPIVEIEPNGILVVVIQVLLIIFLSYRVFKKDVKITTSSNSLRDF